jgi:hypothetical protein
VFKYLESKLVVLEGLSTTHTVPSKRYTTPLLAVCVSPFEAPSGKLKAMIISPLQ